jgi:hypothetical protein
MEGTHLRLISKASKKNLCLDSRPCCNAYNMFLAGNNTNNYKLSVQVNIS